MSSPVVIQVEGRRLELVEYQEAATLGDLLEAVESRRRHPRLKTFGCYACGECCAGCENEEVDDDALKAVRRREVVALAGAGVRMECPPGWTEPFDVRVEMADRSVMVHKVYPDTYMLDAAKFPTHYIHVKFDRDGGRATLRMIEAPLCSFDSDAQNGVTIALDDTMFGETFKGIADMALKDVDLTTLNMSRLEGMNIVAEGCSVTEIVVGHVRTYYRDGSGPVDEPVYV